MLGEYVITLAAFQTRHVILDSEKRNESSYIRLIAAVAWLVAQRLITLVERNVA